MRVQLENDVSFQCTVSFSSSHQDQSTTQLNELAGLLSDNIARTSRPLFEGASGAQLSVTVATGEI